jgi:hypothetical protein
VNAGALSLSGFISHTIPTSIMDAMARNRHSHGGDGRAQ